jgi:S1-C subfamily serine protease
VVSPPAALTYLSFGDTTKLEVGDDVHAIGHPDGQVWTYTTGTISQIRPKFRWKDDESGHMHEATVIQTQTAINPGNSGGPLLDDHAEIIGINSFQMKGEQGLNYAIAADSIQDFLKHPVKQSATSTASLPSEKPLRVEHFGKHVIGEYVKSQTPPPDLWLVYGENENDLKYAATGMHTKKRLNTVIMNRDSGSQGLAYYIDTNCDGIVDLR